MIALLILLSSASSAPVCLDRLRDSGQHVSKFDFENDIHGDASYSCTYSITPSQAQMDLNALLSAADEGDYNKLSCFLSFPFGFVEKNGKYVEISRQSFTKFAPKIADSIKSKRKFISISNLGFGGWRGLFADDGKVVLNTTLRPNGQRHLVLVSIDAR
mgnify:CR=1 FL=1